MKLGLFLIEPDEFPGLIGRLAGNFGCPTEIHLEVPALIDGQMLEVAHLTASKDKACSPSEGRSASSNVGLSSVGSLPSLNLSLQWVW